MPEFFVVVPPGLEEDFSEELKEFSSFLVGKDGLPVASPFTDFKIEKGGVTLKGEPLVILQIHYFSKIASRILLRLGRFHANEFFQLEKGLRSLKIESWVGSGTFHLQVDAQKSKINNEKRIFEVASQVWKKQLQTKEVKFVDEKLFLRNDDDEVTVSLDLTGEHLHKRGSERELGGVAPIRETLAAALVRFLIGGAPLNLLREVTLLDPMAGSGTLLIEANQIYQPLLQREFAFQKQSWIPSLLKSASFFSNYRQIPTGTWKRFIALDRSLEARERLRHLPSDLVSPLEIFAPNEFVPEKTSPLWVISNPPYGERLEKIPAPQLRELLLKADPERVAVILPKALGLELIQHWPKNWEIEKKPVQNGGLPCFLIRFLKLRENRKMV